MPTEKCVLPLGKIGFNRRKRYRGSESRAEVPTRNPRKEFLRAALLGRNSVTDIPVEEHYHRVMKQLGRQEPQDQERKNHADLSAGPPSMLEAFAFSPLELMTHFSYQRRCIHAERVCNFENPTQTRVYEATFKLTYIRDIAAQLISE
jgi:hypothetical protein